MMIPVVAAVIRGHDSVLLAKRPDHLHQGGLWEFPGGKHELDETREAALVRELQEELGITPTVFRPLIQIPHHYPDKSVLLDVWEVSEWQGEPAGLEGQEIAWVKQDQLSSYDYPAANTPIIKACQLPSLYLITPELGDSEEAFLDQLGRALDAGIQLVQLRQKTLPADQYEQLAKQVIAVCHQRGAKVLLNALPEIVMRLGADGVQLNATMLMDLQERPVSHDFLVAASCHNPAEIGKACKLGLDFVALSPVQATATHPDANPLGWPCFAQWVSESTLPVYALGGVSREDEATAWQHGGQGISAIRALWETPE